jgi:hypothetical protein
MGPENTYERYFFHSEFPVGIVALYRSAQPQCGAWFKEQMTTSGVVILKQSLVPLAAL